MHFCRFRALAPLCSMEKSYRSRNTDLQKMRRPTSPVQTCASRRSSRRTLVRRTWTLAAWWAPRPACLLSSTAFHAARVARRPRAMHSLLCGVTGTRSSVARARADALTTSSTSATPHVVQRVLLDHSQRAIVVMTFGMVERERLREGLVGRRPERRLNPLALRAHRG